MKMIRTMDLFVLAVLLVLPAHVAGGGLRGLLHPLQMPPPPTADAAFMEFEAAGGAPAPAPIASPAGAPGPAPAPQLPEEPKMPKITSATCAALQKTVSGLIGGAGSGPAPAPAPGAALMQGGAPSPAAAGEDKPTAECKIYAFVSGKGAGCTCFVETPPPPFKAKVSGCPSLADGLSMGFTGGVVAQAPMAFGGQTGGWVRQTCTYRQWFFDPQATGPSRAYQIKLNDARAKKYITDTYAASLRNAHNTASAFWALTPVPWLKLYPTTPWPVASAPGPAPGPALPSTTAPILFADQTTPAMMGFTTRSPFLPPLPFGATTASPFGTTPSAFGAFGTTTAPAFGMPTTPAAFGATTAPTYAVVR